MREPLRVLILEDNPSDAELVQFELQEAEIKFTAKVVMTEEDFVRELQESLPISSSPIMTSLNTTAHWRWPKRKKGAPKPHLFWSPAPLPKTVP